MEKPWTIKEILERTVSFFEEKNVPEPRLSAELLLSHALKCKRLDLYLQFERFLTATELADFREMVRRRAKQEPVQYITGEQEFMGFTFRVTPAVLIPRPETELLVEAVLKEIQSREEKQEISLLEVGTGSGAIAISLAKLCPHCRITAIDVSSEAIEIATENARRLEVTFIRFFVRDARDFTPDPPDGFDLIVSNPPYVSEPEWQRLHPQVKDYEPSRALLAGPDGLDFYRAFLPRTSSLLTKTGSLFMEIGFDQKENVFNLLKQAGFRKIEFIPDYQKIERIVKAKL